MGVAGTAPEKPRRASLEDGAFMPASAPAALCAFPVGGPTANMKSAVVNSGTNASARADVSSSSSTSGGDKVGAGISPSS